MSLEAVPAHLAEAVAPIGALNIAAGDVAALLHAAAHPAPLCCSSLDADVQAQAATAVGVALLKWCAAWLIGGAVAVQGRLAGLETGAFGCLSVE